MKIILNREIENLGDIGDLVEVKPGYARNYLFPNGFALPVNKHNMDVIASRRKKVEKEREAQTLTAQELKTKLEAAVFTFKMKAGEKDVLFGSVGVADIEEKVREMGVEVDRKKYSLTEPIKKLGSYKCSVKLFREVVAELKIEVEAEGEAE